MEKVHLVINDNRAYNHKQGYDKLEYDKRVPHYIDTRA
jgi:hypothetical protein